MILLGCLVACCAAVGQETSGPAADSPEAASTEEAIQEFHPPLYLLRDEKGKLQPVPGFTLKDFNELYELKHALQQSERAPDFSLQTMTVSGTVQGENADLTIELTVLVRDAVCRVPLRLDQAVLRKQPQYDGPGEHFLNFEANGEGYVSWIRNGANKQHKITLAALVPLSSVGQQRRLRLRCPRATTSELKLTVPLPDAVASVSEPATLLAASTREGKATELAALGLGGDFELEWRPKGAKPLGTPTALDAVGELAARIDGRTVNSQLDLTVRAYGSQFDRFEVRLPEGTRLEPGSPSGYVLTPMAENVVEVRFPVKAAEQRAELVFSQIHDVNKPDDWFELAGYEVLGAARHRGHIAVAVTGDWHVLWKPPRAVRQTEELPEGLKIDGLVAGFEYFSQPCSLRAQLAPKKTRVTVEPEYRLMVGATQVQLEATLDFLVRGAKVSALQLEMPDWQLDEVAPDNLVIADAVSGGLTKPISIPLKQPSLGHVRVSIRAHQEIKPDTAALSLSLPRRPQVDAPAPAAVVVLPATVVVLPEDNVELTPDDKAMAGLLRQQVTPAMSLPKRQQQPLFYRGEAANLVFSSQFAVHPRQVSVEAASQVSVDQQSVEVEQTLAYTIGYEVVGSLGIDVPRDLIGLEEMSYEVDGQTVAAVIAAAAGAEEAQSVRMTIALPEPRIGPCQLVIRYRMPTEVLLPQRTVLRRVPLVMPAEAALVSNKLYATAAEGIELQLREGPWTMAEPNPPRPSRGRALRLSAGGAVDEVVLAVDREELAVTGSTVAERAWIQTWLTQEVRQDRAVFQLHSNRKQITVDLPEGVSAGQMEVRLDGSRVGAEIDERGRLTVSLPESGGVAMRLLELRYHLPSRRPFRGALSLELPRLADNVWVRRMYWQLILPRNEHVIVSPEGFTCEFQWGWQGMFWGRVPLWDQAKLETWVGAEHRAPLPSEANAYLFSTLGSVETAQLRTAGRSIIVLVASLAALAAGLLLIYVPFTRHPASLFAAAIALAAAAVLYPEPTLLAAQAASLGLALALMAGLLERTFSRRRRPAGSAFETLSAIRETDSTQTQYRAPAVGSQGSTQTAPAVMPMSTSDSTS